MLLRHFRESDTLELSKLVYDTFSEVYSNDFYGCFADEWPKGFIVAEERKRVVGLIVGTIEEPRVSRVLLFAVHWSLRGRGLGSRMLDRFKRASLSSGAALIRLEVREENQDGIRFYENHGFWLVGTLKDYYKDGRHGVLMQTELFKNALFSDTPGSQARPRRRGTR